MKKYFILFLILVIMRNPVYTQNVFEVGTMSGGVKALNFSADGNYLVSADNQGQIFIWNIEGKKIREITGFKAEITGVAFNSSDDKIFACACKEVDKNN